MRKPILLGLINPHPTEDLYIRPLGCSGHRLAMLFAGGSPKWTQEDYLDLFDRRNLLTSMEDNPAEAAERFKSTLEKGDQVVLLGEAVRRSLDLPKMLIHPLTVDGITYRQIPHPSGRNRFYNDPALKFLVGDMLRSLVKGEDNGSPQ